MISVNIHGSCVSRGVFDISEFGAGNFEVKEYIAKNNIFSLFSEPTYIEKFANVNDCHALDWNTRMVYYDLEKKVFEALKTNSSDIVLIDLIDQRIGMLGKDNRLVTNSEALVRTDIYELINMTDKVYSNSFDYFSTYKVFRNYASELKKLYDVGQIFIIEVYPVMAYYDGDGEVCAFDNETIKKVINQNKLYQMQYSILKELLAGCYVIDTPRYIIADSKHRFGCVPNHFHKSMYDYIAKRIYGIMENKMI